MAKYCIAAYRIIALIICLEIKYFFLKSKNWVARSAHACVQFVFLPSRFIPLDFIAFESPANFPFSMHLAAAFLLPTLPKNPPPFHHLYSAVLFFSYRINHLFEKPTAIQLSKDSPRLYAIDVHGIDQCAPTARLEWATNMAAKQAIRRHFEVCSATVKSMPGYSGDIFLFIMKSMYFTVKARVRGYKVM